jgi:hypothetical protein
MSRPRTLATPACTDIPWQATLDSRITAVCALLTTTPVLDAPFGGWPAKAILAATSETVRAQPLPVATGRQGGGRQQIACYAAVYGRYFLPSSPWRLTRSPAAAVLRWEHPDSRVLLDAPRGTHSDAPPATDTLRAVLAAHANEPHLVGMRLLTLASPLASRLLLPDGTFTDLPALSDTTPTLALAFAG